MSTTDDAPAQRTRDGVGEWLTALAHRYLDNEQSLIALVVHRFIAARPIDTALALGSRLFVAVLPLSIIATALTPVNDSFARTLIRALALEGAGADAARAMFTTPDVGRIGASIFGLIVLLYSLSSYARSLQQVFLTVWGLRSQGAVELRRRLLWLVGLAVYLFTTLTFENLGLGSDWHSLARVGSGVAAVLFYTWTPWLLLGRRVPSRDLVPTIVLLFIASTAFAFAAEIYMPITASGQAERYGIAGFAFALLTYLFAESLKLVLVAIVGAALTEWWQLRRSRTDGTAAVGAR